MGGLLIALLAVAQMAQPPVLHHRSDREPDDSAIVVREHARSILPQGASGEYKLGDSGEVVQITDQFGEVSGYISRIADAESDRGALLTYFFTRAAGSGGERLTFTTRQVHGVWYSFEGAIVRGPGRTRAEAGYYLLEGSLVAHDEARRTTQRRAVSLQLAGER